MRPGDYAASNSEMRKEFSLFGEVWQLYKNYYNGDKVTGTADDPEHEKILFWTQFLQDMQEIADKYKSELCDDLLLAVTLELERKVNG